MNIQRTFEKRKSMLALFIFNFLMIIVAYGGLMRPHYATDTYNNMYSFSPEFQLTVGRYSDYLLIKAFDIIRLPCEQHPQLFMFISLIFLTVGTVLLYRLCSIQESSTIRRVGTDIGAIICLVNVFNIELYLFPEYVACYSIGIVVTIYSVVLMFKDRGLCYLLAFFMLILALGFYQAFIGVYIIVFLGACWIRRVQKKIFPLLGLGIGGVACFVNILLHKLLVETGTAGVTVRDAQLNLQTIFNNLRIILFDKSQGQKAILFHGAGLLPPYFLLAVVVCLTVILLTAVFLKERRASFTILTFLMLVVMYASIYAPHFVAGEVWLSPRAIMPMFFFVGMLVMMAFHVSRDSSVFLKILSVVVAVLFTVNYWSVQGIIVNHFATNKIDQEYAYDIYKEIERYENETGITVQNIAAINDDIPSWKNHFVDYYSFNINERAFINEWSDVYLIDFVSGRLFNKIPIDENIYQLRFAGHDWDFYCPEEQLYFEGDTLYWCKY